ncbi:hypothetical protein ACTJI8_12915 [Microbacterium sp. 22303]|uniref:hypothetical protein n=1 Tax=Microbacterium sp. 22303 TaxID=3453905 RepID=UPI003F87CBDE
MSGRFDPREGENYGECMDCGIALTTGADAEAHRAETMAGAPRSHRTRGMNPDRESRIRSHVDAVVSAAISDALDELQGDIDDGHATEEEIVTALAWHSDFASEWKEDA